MLTTTPNRRSRRAARTAVALAAVVALTAAGRAGAAVPTTTRVVGATGQELDRDARGPAVSANGRWVAFESDATNAVAAAATGVRQVYLADRATGAVRLVSRAANGAPGDHASAQPTISADGRFVAFQSAALNLAPSPTNLTDDAFLYDRASGTLRRLSMGLGGGDASDWARDVRVSADGSTVVFTSPANDLVPGDTGMIDVFAVPTAGGPLERVSARPGGGTANGDSLNGAASDGGRFVAFATDASDVVAGDNNAARDIVVLDRSTGARTRANVTSSGGEAVVGSTSNFPSITADGCLVVFVSTATNLVGSDDKSGAVKAFVRDRCTANTEFASIRNTGAQAAVLNRPPAISDDGCIVAMVSSALTDGAPIGGAIALRDRCEGATSRADVSSAGELGNAAAVGWPRLSAGSGRYVSFASLATNLVFGDGNNVSDAFVRDRANAVPPVAALAVTASGLRATADASASRDPDAAIASVSIAWGDGTPDSSGVTAGHDYARAGTFAVTATVTDTDGLTAIASRAVTVDGPAAVAGAPPTGPPDSGPAPQPEPQVRPRPRLTIAGGHLSHTRFAVVRAGGRISGRRGAVLSVTASAAARLELRFERAIRGRRSRGRCAPRARRGAHCTTFRLAGTTRAGLRPGANRVAVTGRVAGRALAPGRYRLRLVARTAAGLKSAELTTMFTLTRR